MAGEVVQAKRLVDVTPDDSTDLGNCTIYVGVSGNLAVEDLFGNTVTLENVPVGWQPILVTKVLSTGTTAASIVAGYYNG